VKILLNYSKEIPCGEIVTEEFFEDENIISIRSLIMVERETQKESLGIKVLGMGSC
jgi:GTP-binding protein Era